MKKFIAYFFLCVSLSALSTHEGISSAAAERDFRVMNAIFARSHATAFRQIPAREAPLLFSDVKVVSIPLFLSRILTYYSSLHADHTMVGFPPELIEKYNLKDRLFPLPLKFFGEHAFLDTRLAEIPFGAELTSINGKSIPEILNSFRSFPRGKELNTTLASYYLSEQFSSWYFLSGEAGAPWHLQFFGIDKKVKFLTPRGVPVRISTNREYWKPILYSMFMDKKKVAYFAINSFIPAGTAYNSMEKWMEYFGAFNTESRMRGAKILILDLRANRGGVMPLAASSASWFIENKIEDRSTSRVHTRLLPYREFAVAINGQNAKQKDFDKLEDFLARDFSDTIKNGYFETRNPEARFVSLHPLENIYRFEKIYVLIGPQTYSAAVYFARLLKLANSHVTLVGTQTGSPGDGHSAETLVTYRLPESGIFFDVPLARVEFSPLVPGQVKGQGLMPDKEVKETLDDFRLGRDTVLETVVSYPH
ncbi:MAG: hypothetical protein LDLANPLL_00374 [Turneriella sp.]|nr:hypothetical protein [Turneriella sp.]